MIKYEHTRNSRIERLMNPAKSFPIEQSYINLAVVETKKQHVKESRLRNAEHNNDIMETFEEIYGTKTVIDIKDIFKTCKSQEKQMLVFGRAGIGKSTFCRYIAYQWAKSSCWSEYELLALIPLRRLTTNRYSSNKNYSLIDLIKKEVFFDELSGKEEELLTKQFDAKKTLWILDGYDEIVQKVPPHLECLLERLLKTPHHIITSRPYLNTLSYEVQMEITGFTDKNIIEYVQQFFEQMKDEVDNVSTKTQTVLQLLKSNQQIWGVAHIPVNLELICSLWSNEDWSNTKPLTITALYTTITEWLCRRYLVAQDTSKRKIHRNKLYQICKPELTFLESLAFHAMASNSIIIPPSLVDKALAEAEVTLDDSSYVLNVGFLKSFNKQGTGTGIETDKDHYFIHLSFQEYFAARYLVNALKASSNTKAIEFIQRQKYNQRYALVFTFVSGILSERDGDVCGSIFWEAILKGSLDLVGIRHMQLLISTIDATSNKSIIPKYTQLLEYIANCITYNVSTKNRIIQRHLSRSLQRAQLLLSEPIITNVLIELLQHHDTSIKEESLLFFTELDFSNPSPALITLLITTTIDKNRPVRWYACQSLGNLGKEAMTNEVITNLVSALGDQYGQVGEFAFGPLKMISEKGAKNEVITNLVSALGDQSESVRVGAYSVLRDLGEKPPTNEVITDLASALRDQSEDVRRSAAEFFRQLAQTVGKEVITDLVSALGDRRENVRAGVCLALVDLDTETTTNEVLPNLVNAMGEGPFRYYAIHLKPRGDRRKLTLHRFGPLNNNRYP